MTLLSGAELKAARKAAASRYALIAYRHTPNDVLVMDERKSLTGRAWGPNSQWGKRIDVPEPTTRRRLQIYLHEVAHIVLNHFDKKKPRHVQEMEAEQWSFRIMREEGVPVPRKSVKRAKAYVAYEIRQANRRGAKKIDRAAASFAAS